MTVARMGAQYLFDRQFAQARACYRRAIAMGRRDPATCLRCAAAHFPPLAFLYWWLKAALLRDREPL